MGDEARHEARGKSKSRKNHREDPQDGKELSADFADYAEKNNWECGLAQIISMIEDRHVIWISRGWGEKSYWLLAFSLGGGDGIGVDGGGRLW